MKKRTILKLIVLATAVALMAAVFAGCVFYYDEDTDLSQVILEINPVELTYEIPLTDDYVDPLGNSVYKLNDGLDEFGNVVSNIAEVRKSENFGKATDEVVKTVRRTHDGAAIHKAKIKDGKVVYVGFDYGDDGVKVIETVEGDENWEKRSRQETSNEYFVEPVDGIEYRYDGVVYNDAKTAYVAKWTKVSNGDTVYGGLAINAVQNSGSFAVNDKLPLINYDPANDTYYRTELTPAYETATFKTEKEEFFKSTMITYFNNYAQSFVSQGYKNVDDIFNRFVNMLSTSYLARQEAIAEIKSGNAEWGVTEINSVNRAIYSGIDSALNSIYTEISVGRNENVPEVTDAQTPSTTYPTAPTETPEDTHDYEVWHITQTPERIPGNDSDAKRASYERAAMRTLVKNVGDYVENQYAMSAADRKAYQKEVDEMTDMLKGENGVQELYARLYTYEIIRAMYGESSENSLQLQAFRTYLGRDVEADDARSVYAETLAEQRANFDDDINKYYDACKNNETVLYFADEEYFWVKHILIPFSDTQTANLAAEKQRGKTDEQIAAYRESLGKNVVVYKHVDGENDTSKTYTIDEAYDNIRAEMARVQGSAYEASRKFDELIYTYNTDPGIFNNEMGYAVTKTPALEGGAAETYMIEFATAARELYNAYKAGDAAVGSISAPVLTDYGWHILYLNFVPEAGQTRQLGQYLTAGNYTTVDEALKADSFNTKLDAKYQAWQSELSAKYRAMDKTIVPHKERFKSRLKEYEKVLFGNNGSDEEE